MTPDLHWQAWCGWPGGCPPAAPPGSRGRCQGPPPGRRRPGRSDAAPSWRSPPGPWSPLALHHPLSGNPFYLMPLRLNTLCMNSCHPISPLALPSLAPGLTGAASAGRLDSGGRLSSGLTPVTWEQWDHWAPLLAASSAWSPHTAPGQHLHCAAF